MWNPCLPGVSPLSSASTRTPSLCLMKTTLPATLLPCVGVITAIAFVTSAAEAYALRVAPAARNRRDFFQEFIRMKVSSRRRVFVNGEGGAAKQRQGCFSAGHRSPRKPRSHLLSLHGLGEPVDFGGL